MRNLNHIGGLVPGLMMTNNMFMEPPLLGSQFQVTLKVPTVSSMQLNPLFSSSAYEIHRKSSCFAMTNSVFFSQNALPNTGNLKISSNCQILLSLQRKLSTSSFSYTSITRIPRFPPLNIAHQPPVIHSTLNLEASSPRSAIKLPRMTMRVRT